MFFVSGGVFVTFLLMFIEPLMVAHMVNIEH
jgi:hypothetical protein